MAEALPEEEPSVLISAKALRLLADYCSLPYWEADDLPGDLVGAVEEADSALERYK